MTVNLKCQHPRTYLAQSSPSSQVRRCVDCNSQVEPQEGLKTCSICEAEYEGWGNNAEPINPGRCCDSCNWNQVIPARIIGLTR